LKDEKISLCCITGNCEGIIGSFIEIFRPVADEICIVRAIGGLKKDRSLSIAVEKGCRVSEYFNSNDRADWPHVGRYDEARNVAWEMASHEWVMWADIDDTIDEASIKELRRLVNDAPADIEMIQCPYVVPDQHIHRNMRERIARRGKFRWQMPVHEFLIPIDAHQYKVVPTKRAKVVHAAKSDRRASCERNVRILEAIPPKERGAWVDFYLFTEYHGVGRLQDSVNAATRFLEAKDSQDTEKYEVLIQLSQIAKDPAEMEALLHEAHKICPHRAEALYELTNLALTFGNVDRAKAYARQMRVLPAPEGMVWNVRDRFYGWVGKQLECQVLRCEGQGHKATALEYNIFKKADGRISLLHATRGRTLKATMARATWFDKAANPEGIEHIFAFDADDEHSQPLRRFRHVILDGRGGCVEAWNVAAHLASGDVLIQLSDDWVPPDNWDKLILERLGDLSQPKVLQVSDGSRKDGLLCMAIVTRKRWEDQGKNLFHPDFTGVYSDTWFSKRAFEDGVVVDARDLEFQHLHPFWGKAENDETYQRQNTTGRYVHGQRIYHQLEAAKGRTINTHCCVRLGDNLCHLQFLRRLARRYPGTKFYHSALACYLPQMREVVRDLPNIELGEEMREGAIEAWKNHEGWWETHPLKNDFANFYIAWFDELAKRMGLENPIKDSQQLLFDYPALLEKTPMDGPFDFLIVNSPPMSGQLRSYTDLATTCTELKSRGFKVITTCPILGVESTQDYKLSVSAIGSLSRQCRFIIMVSTGPSWPTFNIYNLESVELRIVLLDNEKLELAPNTVQVSNESSILPILKERKIIA
jgi:hypothetical protein